MSDNEIEFEDVEDALRRADELAELTGRDKKDIIADLLDDGVLNKSAGEDAEEKKDFLDKAQEQAEKLKTLLTTLIPVFALLMGIGAEGLGVLDLTDWGSESIWEDDGSYPLKGGCLDSTANNYDPAADYDDGSCFWDGNGNGGGGGPPCQPEWRFNEFSYLEERSIMVNFDFYDDKVCNIPLDGHFVVFLYQNGNSYDDTFVQVGEFMNFVEVETSFDDLPEGNYHFRVEFHDINCEDGSCEHGDEWTSPHQPTFTLESEPECSAYLQNHQSYLVEQDAEQDAILISADVAIYPESEDACDSEQFEITWRLEQNGAVKYEHKSWENGEATDSDGADYVTHTFDGVDAGTYEPKIVLKLNEEIQDEKFINSVTVEESEPCDVEIHNHYRGHVAEDAEQDAILVAFRVIPANCEGEQISIDIEMFQPNYGANYTHSLSVSGDSATDITYTFDGIAVGNSWTPTVIASLEGEQLEQIWMWGIDVVEQEPETCDINLFDIELITNNTTATVNFDLDCGYEANDLEGYNVSVQFLVYHVNETNNGENATGPLEWTTQLYYIQGYADDVRTLVLDNFTVENTTHYDFYWYAIWEDADGNQKFIEMTWLNREITA